ncbi:MAG: hypothetical protein RLZZ366_1433, partial [Pseudomonadota bacterium]
THFDIPFYDASKAWHLQNEREVTDYA